MSARPDLNNYISLARYDALCRATPKLPPVQDHKTCGPLAMSFQKRGYCGRGVPMRDLLDLQAPVSFLEDAGNDEIRALYASGAAHVRLIIYGPDRPRGRWDHHIRSIPVESFSLRLTSRASIGRTIALEFVNFLKEHSKRRPAPDTQPDLDLQNIAFISLKRVASNAFQAELDYAVCKRGTF
ncbi:hypothetical protein C8Q80DRAFT_1120151 [Daedaleopsis nitida]|nr:hypothetical protein C8Q80DRAFT_1120151 [Daedaleopsis nitida]